MPVKLLDYGAGIDQIAQAIPSAIQGFNDAEDRKLKRMELAAKIGAEEADRARKRQQWDLDNRKYVNESKEKYGWTDQYINENVLQGATNPYGSPEEGLLADNDPQAGMRGLVGQPQESMLTPDDLNKYSPEKQREILAGREKEGLENRKKRIDVQSAEAGSDTERKAAGFTNRLEQAEQNLSSLMESYDPTGKMEGLKSRLLPEEFKTEDIKKIEQVKRNFITAQLRRESGASISPEELDTANKLYFPMPGDSPDVLAQKAESRRLAIENMKRESGRAYSPYKDPQIKPKGPKPGAVENGYKFKGGDPAKKENWEKVN